MALKSWSLNTVAASQVTDLVVPGANKEVAVVGLVICNCEAVNAAAVVVTRTDSGNITKSTIFKQTLLAGESVHLDTKLFFALSATPDKLRVVSDRINTSFDANGDES